jgi:hypothetical protein
VQNAFKFVELPLPIHAPKVADINAVIMKRGRVQYRRLIEFEDCLSVSDEFEFPLSDSQSSLWETGLKSIFLPSRPPNIVLECREYSVL